MGHASTDRPNHAPPGVRLQRYMAQAGVASRRECERLIEHGEVEVNGRVVTELPVFVDPASDHVVVRGRGLKAAPGRAERVYVMLNKPEKTIASTKDQASPGPGVDARTTILDLVKHPSAARLYPVGRLGFHDTGLVLLTNDGQLAHRLTHAAFGVPKTYEVVVKGSVGHEVIAALGERLGTSGDDEAVRVAKATESGTVLSITIREGRVSLEDLLLAHGCHVKRVARTAIGPLELRGVAVGRWRDLTRAEVSDLREATGLIRSKKQHKPASHRSGKRTVAARSRNRRNRARRREA